MTLDDQLDNLLRSLYAILAAFYAILAAFEDTGDDDPQLLTLIQMAIDEARGMQR